jgi:hypothetical protein
VLFDKREKWGLEEERKEADDASSYKDRVGLKRRSTGCLCCSGLCSTYGIRSRHHRNIRGRRGYHTKSDTQYCAQWGTNLTRIVSSTLETDPAVDLWQHIGWYSRLDDGECGGHAGCAGYLAGCSIIVHVRLPVVDDDVWREGFTSECGLQLFEGRNHAQVVIIALTNKE